MTPAGRTTAEDLRSLLQGSCGDPTGLLGPLPETGKGGERRVRVFQPSAARVDIASVPPGESPEWVELPRVHVDGLFEGSLPEGGASDREYVLRVHTSEGKSVEMHDPYRFPPTLTPDIFSTFRAGMETRLDRLLGAVTECREGVDGVRFAVWAPNAVAVNLMGSFNGWEGRRHPMWPVGESGVWELFVPGVAPGALYKYEIRPRTGVSDGAGAMSLEKADPLGRRMEVRPSTATVVPWPSGFEWHDEEWLRDRARRVAPEGPISVYEVHLGSWRRSEDGTWLGYRDLADTLLPYVRDMGFTHVEILPLTEHPLDRSWGYQTVGYFALTSRYGEPDDFKHFVDEAHRLGIGVILDWAPAHFPLDAHGLWRFDGTAIYEHEDPRRGSHPDWGTAIFDYGKPEVVSFLVSSARFWVEEYHLDGLRVDAVASMLYLDYSRSDGEWEPNERGGRENLEALAFIRGLTSALHAACPGVLLCAEESTAWPGVTAPVEEGGLGFDLKWNMGWMHDSLAVMETEPAGRSALRDRLTFSMHYAYAERYLLPISHDEVVHLKRSLASKMPGAEAERLADVRLFLTYMWTHPGAKLLFMGGEFGQWEEWDEDGMLQWDLLDRPLHAGLSRLMRDLNALYTSRRELHSRDGSPDGFRWLDVDEDRRGVLSYLRLAGPPDGADHVVVALNFSDVALDGHRLAAPGEGPYEVLLDSDDPGYGGEGRNAISNGTVPASDAEDPSSIVLKLAPRSAMLLARSERG